MIQPVLQSARLTLRLPQLTDAQAMTDFFVENRDFLQPWSPTFAPEMFTRDGWIDRIGWSLDEYRLGLSVRFCLFVDEKIIGMANFTSTQGFPAYKSVLGYALAEAYQGKGLMHEALEKVIGYMFTEKRMHRIEANYMPRNTRSGSLLERLGFQKEGFSKDYLLINGKWEDHVRTALANKAWGYGVG